MIKVVIDVVRSHFFILINDVYQDSNNGMLDNCGRR